MFDGSGARSSPGKAADFGRTGVDNRLFVNGCLWVLRSGAHWCNLPERYGKWKTVYRRFSRWCHAGDWERVFKALTADRDNRYLREYQEFCAGGRYRHQMTNRSPKMTANWVFASDHSRGGRFHS